MPHISDIHIRDPYILLADGMYYLYGARFPTFYVCTSTDLENWSEPKTIFTRPADFWSDRDFWAPECHAYTGPDGVTRYYLFASFKAEGKCRGTQILRCDTPDGTFVPHSDGPVTPRDWECLDGTLWVEDGMPYMVFCHEWVQIQNGTMCVIPLTPDLSAPAGEPITLFAAGDAPWTTGNNGVRVTDGPFLYRSGTGELLMIWASFGTSGYGETVCRSESGKLAGPWIQAETPIMPHNGGHGMLFRDKAGALHLVLHQPNTRSLERPKIFDIEDCGDTLRLL